MNAKSIRNLFITLLIFILPLFNISFAVSKVTQGIPAFPDPNKQGNAEMIEATYYGMLDNYISVTPSIYSDLFKGWMFFASSGHPLSLQIRFLSNSCGDIVMTRHDVIDTSDPNIGTHLRLEKVFPSDVQSFIECANSGIPFRLEYITISSNINPSKPDWGNIESIQVTLNNWRSNEDNNDKVYVLYVNDVGNVVVDGQENIYKFNTENTLLEPYDGILNFDNKKAILVFTSGSYETEVAGSEVAKILGNLYSNQNIEVFLITKDLNSNSLTITLQDLSDKDGEVYGGFWLFSPYVIMLNGNKIQEVNGVYDYSYYYQNNLSYRSCYYNDKNYYAENQQPCWSGDNSDYKNSYDSLDYWQRRWLNENKLFTINLNTANDQNIRGIFALNNKDDVAGVFVANVCNLGFYGDLCYSDYLTDDTKLNLVLYTPSIQIKGYSTGAGGATYLSSLLINTINPLLMNLVWTNDYFYYYGYNLNDIFRLSFLAPVEIMRGIKAKFPNLEVNGREFFKWEIDSGRWLVLADNNDYIPLYFYSLSSDANNYEVLVYSKDNKKLLKMKYSQGAWQTLNEVDVSNIINDLGCLDNLGTYLEDNNLVIIFGCGNKAKYYKYSLY